MSKATNTIDPFCDDYIRTDFKKVSVFHQSQKSRECWDNLSGRIEKNASLDFLNLSFFKVDRIITRHWDNENMGFTLEISWSGKLQICDVFNAGTQMARFAAENDCRLLGLYEYAARKNQCARFDFDAGSLKMSL